MPPPRDPAAPDTRDTSAPNSPTATLAARANAAANATGWVPDRTSRSCPPPNPTAAGTTERRASSAPTPTGPPILCADTLIRSTPLAPKSNGRCPKACTASVCIHAPSAAANSPTAETGCTTPVSLFTHITDTTATASSSVSSRAPSDTTPSASHRHHLSPPRHRPEHRRMLDR